MRIENELFYAVKEEDYKYNVFFRYADDFVGEFYDIGGEYNYFYNWKGCLDSKHLIALGNLLKEVNRKEKQYDN